MSGENQFKGAANGLKLKMGRSAHATAKQKNERKKEKAL